jgi:hypothetical protein
MTDKNKTFLVAFLIGFILSCLTSYFIESSIAKLFDDLSSGNMDLRNAPDPSEWIKERFYTVQKRWNKRSWFIYYHDIFVG